MFDRMTSVLQAKSRWGIATLLAAACVLGFGTARAQDVQNPAVPFTNSGTINSVQFNDGGAHNAGGATAITNAASGKINAGNTFSDAVSVNNGSSLLGGILNNGAITSQNGNGVSVFNSGSSVTGDLVNNGSITPSGNSCGSGCGFVGMFVANGGALNAGSGGTGSIINNGAINLANALATGISVQNGVVAGSLTNTNAISGGATGISAIGSGSVGGGIFNSGNITTSSTNNLFFNTGIADSVNTTGGITNSGTITDTGGHSFRGIQFFNAASVLTGNIVNSGSITDSTNLSLTTLEGISVAGALKAGGGGTGAIINSGTINVTTTGNLATATGIDIIATAGANLVPGGITNTGTINATTTAIDLTGLGLLVNAARAPIVINQNAGALSALTAVAMSNVSADVLNINGGAVNGNITGGPASTLNVTGGTLVGNVTGLGTFNVNRSDAFTYAGVFSGTGSFVKTGTGTTTFTGANTYSGATSVNAGSLKAGVANTFSAASAVTVASGATLDLNGFNQTIGSLAGAGNVTLGAGTLTAGGNNTNTSFSGTISGSGGLTKAGTGTLTLSGFGSYAGPTLLQSGTIKSTGTAGFGAGSSPLTMAAGTTLDTSAASATFEGLSGAGSILTAGTAGLALTLNNNIAGTFAGSITGTGSLTLLGGGGSLTLMGNNTYSGTTFIFAGVFLGSNPNPPFSATLTAGAPNVFSPNSQVDMFGPGGTLALNGFNQTIGSLSGFGVVTLGSATLTTGGDNTSTSFNGTISGTGGLTKTGTGTFTLTQGFGFSAMYTGPTLVSGGVLQAGAANSFAPASAVTINAGATLDLNNFNNTVASLAGLGSVTLGTGTLTTGGDNTSTNFSGAISGSGGLTKAGIGTFTLNGNSSGFTGSTSVTGGTLVVGDANSPGAVLGGNATVQTAATLSGHGTITGALTNSGGTVAPGGSIGTLTVGGAFTQSAGSTLSIEVSPSAASQLVVGGKATLAGTLALVYDPGIYTAKTYTLVQAGSIAGNFATVTGQVPTAGLGQVVAVNPTTVQLSLTSISSPGPTPTPAPIVVAPTNDTIFPALASTLVLNGQHANSIILDRLGNRSAGIADGQVAGTAPPAQYAEAGAAASLSAVAAALPGATEGAWFRGLGGFASVNGNSTAPGYTGSAGGFLAGYDRPFAENTYAGIAAGYLHSNVTEHSTSSGDADTARVALYGGTWIGEHLFTATAGYAHDRIGTSRGIAGIGTASESHSANEATAAVQWSRAIAVTGMGDGITTLTPKAGVQFLHLGESGFSESGAAGFNLSSGSRDTDSLQPYIGIAVSQKFLTDSGALVTPELRLGYAREVLSNARNLSVTTLSGAAFPVIGVAPSRDQVTAGFGVTMLAGPGLALYANYDTLLRTGNTTDHTVSAGLRIKF